MSSSEIGLVLLVVLISGIPGAYIGNYITQYNTKCRQTTSTYTTTTTENHHNDGIGPVISVTISIVLYIVTTTVASYTLTGPQTKNLIYIYGIFWGMCQGWMHPQNTTIYVTITPFSTRTRSGSGSRSIITATTSAIPSQDVTTQSSLLDSQQQQTQPQRHIDHRHHNHTPVELMGLFMFVTQILSFLPPLVFTILNEKGIDMKYGLFSLNLFFMVAFVPLLYLLWGNNYSNAIKQATDLAIVGDGGVVVSPTFTTTTSNSNGVSITTFEDNDDPISPTALLSQQHHQQHQQQIDATYEDFGDRTTTDATTGIAMMVSKGELG